MRHLYPEEVIVAIALGVMAIVFISSPQSFHWYDPALSFSIFNSVVIPAFVYCLALFLYYIIRSHHLEMKVHRLLWRSFSQGLRVWLIFYVALVIKFNVKMNVGVWRDVLYDPGLYAIDHWLGQWFGWFGQWHRWLDGIYDVTPLYTLFYQMLYLGSFILISCISARAFRELFAATIFTLFLGCIGYVLMPALGPFIYVEPPSPQMQIVFQHMFFKYHTYVSSGGLEYVPSFLTQGLAAMPSLHMANTAVFVYFIWRYARLALIVYLPVALFIAIEALYTKFHYLLDLIIGVEIACIAIVLAHWIYAYRYQNAD